MTVLRQRDFVVLDPVRKFVGDRTKEHVTCRDDDLVADGSAARASERQEVATTTLVRRSGSSDHTHRRPARRLPGFK